MDRRSFFGALVIALAAPAAIAAPVAGQIAVGEAARTETVEVRGRGRGRGHGRKRRVGWHRGRGHAWGRRRKFGW